MRLYLLFFFSMYLHFLSYCQCLCCRCHYTQASSGVTCTRLCCIDLASSVKKKKKWLTLSVGVLVMRFLSAQCAGRFLEPFLIPLFFFFFLHTQLTPCRVVCSFWRTLAKSLEAFRGQKGKRDVSVEPGKHHPKQASVAEWRSQCRVSEGWRKLGSGCAVNAEIR